MPPLTAAQRRRHVLADALTDLRSAAASLPAVEAAWADLAPPDMKAQNLTPPMGRPPKPLTDQEQTEAKTTSISDPTGEAAMQGLTSGARHAEGRIDGHIRRLAKSAKALADELARYAIENPLQPEEMRQLELEADPGCEVVGRLGDDGRPLNWEEVHTTSDYGGLLARPYRLGAWADQFVRRNGRLPTQAEVDKRRRGERVMVKA